MTTEYIPSCENKILSSVLSFHLDMVEKHICNSLKWTESLTQKLKYINITASCLPTSPVIYVVFNIAL